MRLHVVLISLLLVNSERKFSKASFLYTALCKVRNLGAPSILESNNIRDSRHPSLYIFFHKSRAPDPKPSTKDEDVGKVTLYSIGRLISEHSSFYRYNLLQTGVVRV